MYNVHSIFKVYEFNFQFGKVVFGSGINTFIVSNLLRDQVVHAL